MGYKSRGNWLVSSGETKLKIMSNEYRRKAGLEQDPELPDYKPEEKKDDIRN